MNMKKSITVKDLFSEKFGKEEISSLRFEQGLKLLEELVQSVEQGELSLDDAMTSYEKGALIIEQLRAQLSGAEEKLKVLKK